MPDLEQIPTLRPTLQQLQDPIEFLSQPHVRRLGHTFGMLKLVPPTDFRPPLSIDEDRFKFRVRLQHLNELNIMNRGRLFLMKQLNNFFMLGSRRKAELIQLEKPYTELGATRLYYYDLFIAVVKFLNANSSSAQPSNTGRKRSRSRAESSSSESKSGIPSLSLEPLADIKDNMKLWKHVSKSLEVSVEEARDTFLRILAPYYDHLQTTSGQYGSDGVQLSKLIYAENYPSSLLNDGKVDEEDDDEEEDGCTLCQRTSHRSKTMLCDSCDKPFHTFCLDPPLDEVPRGKWVCNNCIFGNGYYGFKEENKFYSKAAFQEMCRDYDRGLWPNGDKLKDLKKIEDLFWERVYQIDKSDPIRYGADIHNVGPGEMTGFPTNSYIPSPIREDEEKLQQYQKYVEHPMNLVNLPSAKGSLLSVFGKKISGMTVPWIYIGSTFSTFCWHLEDQYTLSANFQHEGDPKVWYSIPGSSCDKFNTLMRQMAPDLFQKQPDLLHQLVTLIAPYDSAFKDAKISCYKAIQYPGEYIITFPKCYHSGFNTGYNFNEAVNFTLDLWLPYGIEATHDYIESKKRCVFDMWELMLTVLVEYLEDPTLFDEALIRRCHLELLEKFNQEVKVMDQLSNILSNRVEATGFTRRHMAGKGQTQFEVQVTVRRSYYNGDSEDDSHDDASITSEDDGDEDIFCTKCKTICPFAFVAHFENARSSKRRRLQSMSPAEWNQMSERGDLKILCLQDYTMLVENTEDDDSAGAGTDLERFKHDELYFIRKPEEIRDILIRAQRKIDGLLR